MKKIIIFIIFVLTITALFPIKNQNGINTEYKPFITKYINTNIYTFTQVKEESKILKSGYNEGYRLEILGKEIINKMENTIILGNKSSSKIYAKNDYELKITEISNNRIRYTIKNNSKNKIKSTPEYILEYKIEKDYYNITPVEKEAIVENITDINPKETKEFEIRLGKVYNQLAPSKIRLIKEICVYESTGLVYYNIAGEFDIK